MNRKTCKKHAKRLALGLAALAIAATPSFAQTTIDLCASDGIVTMPDLTGVPIWGYVDTGGAACTTGLATTLPGPELRLLVADAPVTINLTNALAQNVSFFVPGLRADGVPPPDKFTAEAAANGGTASYTFTNIKAGTYLYHSGTDITTQVPMGLYGALVVDVAAGQAYSDVTYAQDEVLVYSEIDPNLNAAPSTFGGARVINWNPQYFLINGAATADVNINLNEDVLLRFVNAGLRTFFPTLDGGLFLDFKAEDGNRYPQPLEQYGIELQAGKTIDAMVNTGVDGTYALYDRGGRYDYAAYGGGISHIVAGAVAGAPTAVDDPYATAEDTPLQVGDPGDGVLKDGVLVNDIVGTGGAWSATLVSDVSAGTLTLNADGSFTYDPNANFNGIDLFTYVANDGGPDSNVATVTITVTATNDEPVAVADFYDAVEGETLMVAAPGVLGNDIDVDGDELTASVVGTQPPGTLVLNSDGSFEYTPLGTEGAVETFDYEACDLALPCSTATVTITVVGPPANIAPIANDDFAAVAKNSGAADPDNTFSVTANDIDVDGTVVPATVVLPAGGNTQRGGTVGNNGDGTVTYTPKKGFRGTDTFEYTVDDNDGATSIEATVRINVS